MEREWGGRGEGELPLASVGFRAWGNHRKRACSAQRRVGPKAQPTAGTPVPGSRCDCLSVDLVPCSNLSCNVAPLGASASSLLCNFLPDIFQIPVMVPRE